MSTYSSGLIHVVAINLEGQPVRCAINAKHITKVSSVNHKINTIYVYTVDSAAPVEVQGEYVEFCSLLEEAVSHG